MGSGSSRMGSRPQRPRSDHRPKLNFATFLCGGASTSAAAAPPQIGDRLAEKLVLPARLHGPVADNDLQCTVKESPLTSSESRSSSSMNENLRSNARINNGLKENSTLSQNAETSNSGKCFSESKELVPCLSSASSGLERAHSKRTRNMASTSSKPMQLEPSSTITDTKSLPVSEHLDSINVSVSPPPVRFSNGVSPLEPGDMPANGNLTTEINGAGPTLASAASISSSGPTLLAEESLLGATSSGADSVTVGERRHGTGSVLHVDVVSISSNIMSSGTVDASRNEARRNSRRLFWDAFSMRSTRRNYDSSAILSSTEDNDDLGSHDRWLLDVSDDLFASRLDHDSVYLQRRSRGSSGRRWHSRSEIRERLRAGFDNDRRGSGFDNDRRGSAFCPSGLHPDGRCACDSLFMHEESSTRASISRIVMLAEALFEVLDEIHRQPVSLSLSMVSLPAPESVVNSLPVKSHIKNDASGSVDDIEQCYICLAEYEEGDKIRILPCHHEYHMSCVDKWLKEIHGVCPLCRGDVCEGTAAAATAEATT